MSSRKTQYSVFLVFRQTCCGRREKRDTRHSFRLLRSRPSSPDVVQLVSLCTYLDFISSRDFYTSPRSELFALPCQLQSLKYFLGCDMSAYVLDENSEIRKLNSLRHLERIFKGSRNVQRLETSLMSKILILRIPVRPSYRPQAVSPACSRFPSPHSSF
jgi:hypothetical protein